MKTDPEIGLWKTVTNGRGGFSAQETEAAGGGRVLLQDSLRYGVRPCLKENVMFRTHLLSLLLEIKGDQARKM